MKGSAQDRWKNLSEFASSLLENEDQLHEFRQADHDERLEILSSYDISERDYESLKEDFLHLIESGKRFAGAFW